YRMNHNRTDQVAADNDQDTFNHRVYLPRNIAPVYAGHDTSVPVIRKLLPISSRSLRRIYFSSPLTISRKASSNHIAAARLLRIADHYSTSPPYTNTHSISPHILQNK